MAFSHRKTLDVTVSLGARAWLLFSCVLQVTSSASAGGGPENLLLLVNSNSESSQSIANHYVRWRRIPPSNVVYVDWQGDLERTTSEDFRQHMLRPALAAIQDRRLAMQIDYLVYSSDFPWRIDLKDDFTEGSFPKQFGPAASLTGATYLWQYVEAKNRGFVMPNVNWYVSPNRPGNIAQCKELGNITTRAFRHSYLWTPNGARTTSAGNGHRYLLSAMLGVTSGRGNRVDEVLRYLRRSIWADATHPGGTFYFMHAVSNFALPPPA